MIDGEGGERRLVRRSVRCNDQWCGFFAKAEGARHDSLEAILNRSFAAVHAW